MSQVFSYQDKPVRTLTENNEIWFVAKDVCAVLGIGWTGHALKGISDDWQSMVFYTTPRGKQRVRVISEAAVYKLAFRSNKPEADAFTNWVAGEVLPAIRKSGKYEAAPKAKALPRPRQKALPPASYPNYREECARATAELMRLRADMFTASELVMRIFSIPFGPRYGLAPIPVERRDFAEAMHQAIQHFFLALNKDLEAAQRLFKAYVEAEKILNG